MKIFEIDETDLAQRTNPKISEGRFKAGLSHLKNQLWLKMRGGGSSSRGQEVARPVLREDQTLLERFPKAPKSRPPLYF